MDKKETRALNKNRKLVQRLRKRQKYQQAIKLQREVCAAVPREAAEWDLLVEICREASQLEMALAARFESAKVRRAEADEWLELAAEAVDWGFENDAIEARFRAADAYAVSGDFQRAVDLLDQVLAKNPNHRQAQRIRRLMAARLHQANDEDPESVGRKQATVEITRVEEEPPTRADSYEESSSEVELHSEVTDILIDEATSPHWTAAPPASDTGDDLTPVGFVCNVQAWPTILDTRTLTFVGATKALGADLDGLTEEIELGENAPVYIQGHTTQLLYCLDSGTIAFARERGRHHDLGIITAEHFFGELGALMGLPSTTSATTLEPCLLRVVSRKKIQEQGQQSDRVRELIGNLRWWYLETVLNTCPLFEGCRSSWPEGEDVRWLTLKPGETLCDPKASVEHDPLHVIVTGFARISLPAEEREVPLGYLCPGDICGEISPSPVFVAAESIVTAVQLPRAYLAELGEEARLAFEQRVSLCNSALETIQLTVEAQRSLVIDSEGLTPSSDRPQASVQPLIRPMSSSARSRFDTIKEVHQLPNEDRTDKIES